MDSLFHVIEAQQFSRDIMDEIFWCDARDGECGQSLRFKYFESANYGDFVLRTEHAHAVVF